MVKNLGFPIELEGPLVEGAAPKVVASQRANAAATNPVHIYLQLETLARESAYSVVRFFARSLLIVALTSVRACEGGRFTLFRDEKHPASVIRGLVTKSKDGSAMDIYAPAEGILLGKLDWLEQHLADVEVNGGWLFPDYTGDHGHRSNLLKASIICPNTVLPKGGLAKIAKSLFALDPLRLSATDLKALGITGHSFHGSLSDVARRIGPIVDSPPFPIPAGLRLGFSDSDVNEFGHWLRDADAKAAAAATASQRAKGPRLGLPTHGMARHYTSGTGRDGERTRQIVVRKRLIRYLRAAVGHWTADGRIWTVIQPGPPAGTPFSGERTGPSPRAIKAKARQTPSLDPPFGLFVFLFY